MDHQRLARQGEGEGGQRKWIPSWEQGEEDSVPYVPVQQDDYGEQRFAAHFELSSALKVRGKVTNLI